MKETLQKKCCRSLFLMSCVLGLLQAPQDQETHAAQRNVAADTASFRGEAAPRFVLINNREDFYGTVIYL